MNNIAAFLDLQGTLGGKGLGDITEFEFYPFSFEAIRQLNTRGIDTIVLTNQGKIAKGYFTLSEFWEYMDKLKEILKSNGAYLDAVYCCPHLENSGCGCSKPSPGLVYQAVKEHEIDVKNSYVIGDMGIWDMKLAQNIGSKSILVKTGLGKGSIGEFRDTWNDMEPTHVAEDVLKATKWLIDQVYK